MDVTREKENTKKAAVFVQPAMSQPINVNKARGSLFAEKAASPERDGNFKMKRENACAVMKSIINRIKNRKLAAKFQMWARNAKTMMLFQKESQIIDLGRQLMEKGDNEETESKMEMQDEIFKL